MTLRWSPRALRDLDTNVTAARRWVAKLHVRATAMAETPRIGRVVPELERPDVREVFVGAYRIVYRITDDSLLVLTVFDGHKLYPGAVKAALDDE